MLLVMSSIKFFYQGFTIFVQKGWLRVQQQLLCITDHVAAVDVISVLSHQPAKGMYNAVYKMPTAVFPLVWNILPIKVLPFLVYDCVLLCVVIV